jgi:valyl-tRNA synthetase
MTAKSAIVIDPSALPNHFDSRAAESRLDQVWQKLGLHDYDPTRSQAETFVIDTPPPTVSGAFAGDATVLADKVAESP